MMLEAKKARRFGQMQQEKERLSAVIRVCRPYPLLQAYLEVIAYVALAEHMLGQNHKKKRGDCSRKQKCVGLGQIGRAHSISELQNG